ncbi:MAG: type II toxin-antitoxin system prevent-host-death family antitoxin [Anaerolineaceae bacterium]
MTTMNIHEAKTHFSELVAAVERGEEVLISRRGKPVARLVSAAEPEEQPERNPIIFGRFAGQVHTHPSFYDDMTEAELALWYGDDPDDPLNDV